MLCRKQAQKAQELTAATAAAASALAAWHEGAQTACDFPMNLRVVRLARGRCVPHKKHDIVAAPKLAAALNGEPLTFDW